MIKDILHKQILSKKSSLYSWFAEKEKEVFFPFYSSVDLRDSGSKIVPVDANLFPAGFNNICEFDRENIPSIMKEYIQKHYGKIQKIVLLTEEHTQNLYYWDNVSVLQSMIEGSGAKVQICVPGKQLTQPLTLTTAGGQNISIELLNRHLQTTDLIISNNDFSSSYNIPDHIPLNPSPKMGWKCRRKDQFFREYNSLAVEFSKLIEVDPWHLTIKTKLFEPFNLDDPSSLKNLKTSLSAFLKDLQPAYEKRAEVPFAFLKNNSGTYGLGVTSLQSAEEIDQWNYKTKKKMKAAKGGRKVTQLILQEGVPTILHKEGTAEPVIYVSGSQLIGGFLRTHKTKGVRENLNSPGAVYKKLCISDLKVQIEGKDAENVYGWIARLAVLALGFEIKNKTNPS